ncbi:MAG: hypothetical protein ACQETE_06345 [Bacteroidota bacterium]
MDIDFRDSAGKLSSTKQLLTILIVAFVVSSCAGSYNSMNPTMMHYEAKTNGNQIETSYRYNILQENENKKYAKKEFKGSAKMVAVKITNNTNESFVIGKDKHIYSGNTMISDTNSEHVISSLDQTAAGYLLFLLLTPMKLTVQKGGQKPEVTSIGYVIGPGLTLINMIRASSANTSFEQDLKKYNLVGKRVEPGQTVYGLVVKNGPMDPISVK